jgi:hypothetical protein
LRFKEPANLRALPNSASNEIQLIQLIYRYLSTLSISVPKEKDYRKHYTPVSVGNAESINFKGGNDQKCT